MKKKLTILFLSIVLCGIVIYYEINTLAPNRVKTRFVTHESERIPVSLDNLMIAHMANINGDIKSFEKSMSEINKLKPDVVVLSGTLFNETNTEEEIASLTQHLESIKAPLGKIAIISQETMREPLEGAGYNVVYNQLIEIHNNLLNESINIITNSSTDGVVTFTEEAFTILFTHDFNIESDVKADILIQSLPKERYVTVPLFSKNYSKDNKNPRFRIITHMGSGTQENQSRFFSNPELILINLKSKP